MDERKKKKKKHNKQLVLVMALLSWLFYCIRNYVNCDVDFRSSHIGTPDYEVEILISERRS